MTFVAALFLAAILLMEEFAMVAGVLAFTTAVGLLVGVERIVGLLAVFGLIGIAAGLLLGFKGLTEGDAEPLLTTLGLVFVLALVSTVIVLARRRRGRRATAKKVFEATLFLAGVIVVGGCSLALAGFIFLLAVCLAGSRVF